MHVLGQTFGGKRDGQAYLQRTIIISSADNVRAVKLEKYFDRSVTNALSNYVCEIIMDKLACLSSGISSYLFIIKTLDDFLIML